MTVQFLVGARDFLFSKAFRLALRPTQPHTQWVPGGFFCGCEAAGGIKLTIHCYLVARLRMDGIKPLLPLYALWHSQGHLYL
jgi:hypothetical protein